MTPRFFPLLCSLFLLPLLSPHCRRHSWSTGSLCPAGEASPVSQGSSTRAHPFPSGHTLLSPQLSFCPFPLTSTDKRARVVCASTVQDDLSPEGVCGSSPSSLFVSESNSTFPLRGLKDPGGLLGSLKRRASQDNKDGASKSLSFDQESFAFSASASSWSPCPHWRLSELPPAKSNASTGGFSGGVSQGLLPTRLTASIKNLLPFRGHAVSPLGGLTSLTPPEFAPLFPLRLSTANGYRVRGSATRQFFVRDLSRFSAATRNAFLRKRPGVAARKGHFPCCTSDNLAFLHAFHSASTGACKRAAKRFRPALPRSSSRFGQFRGITSTDKEQPVTSLVFGTDRLAQRRVPCEGLSVESSSLFSSWRPTLLPLLASRRPPRRKRIRATRESVEHRSQGSLASDRSSVISPFSSCQSSASPASFTSSSSRQSDMAVELHFVLDSNPEDPAVAAADFKKFLRGCFAAALVEARRERQGEMAQTLSTTSPFLTCQQSYSSHASCYAPGLHSTPALGYVSSSPSASSPSLMSPSSPSALSSPASVSILSSLASDSSLSPSSSCVDSSGGSASMSGACSNSAETDSDAGVSLEFSCASRREAFEEQATRALARVVLDTSCFSRMYERLQAFANARSRQSACFPGDSAGAENRAGERDACTPWSERPLLVSRVASDAPVADETNGVRREVPEKHEYPLYSKRFSQGLSQAAASVGKCQTFQEGTGRPRRTNKRGEKEDARRRDGRGLDTPVFISREGRGFEELAENEGAENGGHANTPEEDTLKGSRQETQETGTNMAFHGARNDGGREGEGEDREAREAREDREDREAREDRKDRDETHASKRVTNSHGLVLYREGVVQRVRQLAALVVDLGQTYDALHQELLERAANEERSQGDASEAARAGPTHAEPGGSTAGRQRETENQYATPRNETASSCMRFEGRSHQETVKAVDMCSVRTDSKHDDSEEGTRNGIAPKVLASGEQRRCESVKAKDTKDAFSAAYEEGKMSLGEAASLIVDQPWYLFREFPVVYEDANLVIISKPFDVRVDVPMRKDDRDSEESAGEKKERRADGHADKANTLELHAKASLGGDKSHERTSDVEARRKGQQLPGAGSRRFNTEFTVADWYRRHRAKELEGRGKARAGAPKETDADACKVRLCHQLDYATSGLLMLAHNQKAARIVQTLLQRREIQKEYLALVYGHPRWSEVEVETLVAPHSTHAFKMMATDALGTPLTPVLPTSFSSPASVYRCLYGTVVPAQASDEFGPSSTSNSLPRGASCPWSASSFGPRLPQSSLPNSPCSFSRTSPKSRAPFGGGPVEDSEPGRSSVDERSGRETSKGEPDTETDTQTSSVKLTEQSQRPVLGKLAVSRMQVIYKGHLRNLPEPLLGAPGALVKLTLLTGRRHQLRVHCEHVGHPIVGDATYGTGDDSPFRMFLHAAHLQFPAIPFSRASSATQPFQHHTCPSVHERGFVSSANSSGAVASFPSADVPGRGEKGQGGRAKTEEIQFLKSLTRSAFVTDPGFQFFLEAAKSDTAP
ncbi:RNA pseudouridine synthase superfamily protein [Toxoplasma gondii GT1]|uniref:RNA pseudouridine synthase superfamily protein n=2 Tax=Toxoplasma gondii TaxID=5811 RepID=S7USQ9_TOXGG|nr:RNA pseudouridine synthase superfamily protein [Toxoplasma gondii GT1]